MNQKTINTGVLPVLGARPIERDYVAGVLSGIPYEVRLADGRWLLYRSQGEQQHSVYMDSMGCVSFSFNNGVEENINWHNSEGRLSEEVIKRLLPDVEDQKKFRLFFNANGQADLSDRALAKLSGTTMQGNTMSKVARKGRNIAIPETVWPYPVEQRTPVFDWDDFYSDIPQDIVDEYSRVFFSVFTIRTEFIPANFESIAYHLKQGPVQIAAGWCPGWGTERPITACDKHNQHATLIDGITDGNYNDFDHYKPFDKLLAPDYNIDGALKIIVDINQPITQPIMQVKENYLYQLIEHPGGFAMGINGKLMVDNNGKDVDKIIASFMVRNRGNIQGKIDTCTLAEWNSVPHIDLKGQPTNN